MAESCSLVIKKKNILFGSIIYCMINNKVMEKTLY